MRPLVLNEKSKATYQSYKNKEIEWYMCDLSKVLKLLIAIDLSVEEELKEYQEVKHLLSNVQSYDEGILVGRAEFANQLWNIINKGESNEMPRQNI